MHKFILLPADEKRLYATVTLWLLAVKVALYLFPFSQIQAWATTHGRQRPKGTLSPKEVSTIIDAIERIGASLASLRINCLPQALVGHRLLHRRGLDVRLKIGVRKDRRHRLIAHAWLEHENRVILGKLENLGQYAPFLGLEGKTQR